MTRHESEREGYFVFDVSELRALADDIRTAADNVGAEIRPAVQETADKVKATMRADMGGSGHFGQAARSITYDTRDGAGFAEAQVGPTKAGAGPLANIAYFGGSHGGGGTVRDPLEAAEEHAADFEQALGDAIEKLL